jgi:hypothetical protein
MMPPNLWLHDLPSHIHALTKRSKRRPVICFACRGSLAREASLGAPERERCTARGC